MRRFLRSLEKEGVRYLLISGQACVLYGASQFTEDVDLWIRPSSGDLRGLLKALAFAGARVHKLTVRPTLRRMRQGHGFHFLIPPDIYLDVMGRPPRVGRFSAAWSRRRRMKTDWGTLPVAAPEDLVLLKRTNRPSDYEAITNLVRVRYEEAKGNLTVTGWCLENTFDVDDLLAFAEQASGRMKKWPLRKALRALLPVIPGQHSLSSSRRSKVARLLAIEAAEVQEQEREYWLPLLRDLKRPRSQGEMIPPGTPVRTLL